MSVKVTVKRNVEVERGDDVRRRRNKIERKLKKLGRVRT